MKLLHVKAMRLKHAESNCFQITTATATPTNNTTITTITMTTITITTP